MDSMIQSLSNMPGWATAAGVLVLPISGFLAARFIVRCSQVSMSFLSHNLHSVRHSGKRQVSNTIQKEPKHF